MTTLAAAREFLVELISQLFHADVLVTEQAEHIEALEAEVAELRAAPKGTGVAISGDPTRPGPPTRWISWPDEKGTAMRLGKRLTDWNAASDAFERERDARLSDARPPGTPRTPTRVLVLVLRITAAAAAVVGTLCGINIGRSIEGWSRPLGLAAPGWAVILAAAVSALGLIGLAAVLVCVDQFRRQTRR
jgi:hypothetical protein